MSSSPGTRKGKNKVSEESIWGTKDKLIHSLLKKRSLWAELVITSHPELV